MISLGISEISAQNSDSSDSNGINWYAYPLIFYTPETNLALGGFTIFLFRLSDKINSKPSNVRLLAYYTLNNQFSVAVKPDIYFNEDKFLLEADVAYSKLVDKYYSVGNNTPEISEPEYDSRNVALQVQLQYEIFKHLRTGLNYEFRDAKITDTRKNPYLLSGSVNGVDGGTSSGLGFSMRYDSRDNIFYPSVGGFYELGFVFFDDFFGSNFEYTKAVLDLRRFFKISDSQVFAYQFYYNFINGSAPFYEVPPLGGEDLMRGYFTGRYRDDNYFATQIEYRWRFWWRFGLAAFIGIGDVAPEISKFKLNELKYSYGGGVRFRIDEAELIDLRLDFAFGKSNSEFYLSYNQAF